MAMQQMTQERYDQEITELKKGRCNRHDLAVGPEAVATSLGIGKDGKEMFKVEGCVECTVTRRIIARQVAEFERTHEVRKEGGKK